MSNRPSDYFGASPKTVLNKPFFHAQDRKAYNVAGGTSVAHAWTTRDLNTVIHNDIQGASLSGNAITLPAGTYYVEGESPLQGPDAPITVGILGIFKDGTKVLQGATTKITTGVGNPGQQIPARVSGVVTLSIASPINLRYYVGVSRGTEGLGASNNAGSITDASIPSIYTDLKIWQLDRSLEIAPVAINSGLQTVPGLDTTGNVMGFDISKTGANQLTITKGSCLDSTLVTPLAFTADKTLTIPSVANTIYHIFCVKTTSEIFEARAYTSEAAVISDTEVDKFRWVGFCVTNASSELYESKQIGDVLWFYPTIPYTILSLPSGNVTTMTELNFSSFVPSSRVFGVAFGAYAGSVYTRFSLAVSSTSVAIVEIGAGTTTTQTYSDLGRYGVASYTNGTQVFFPVSSSVYYMRSQHISYPEAASLYIRTIHLRR